MTPVRVQVKESEPSILPAGTARDRSAISDTNGTGAALTVNLVREVSLGADGED